MKLIEESIYRWEGGNSQSGSLFLNGAIPDVAVSIYLLNKFILTNI